MGSEFLQSTVRATSAPPDGELVRRCQQGDRESFRHLYRRHQLKVRSLLFQLCGSIALDDLVQEVFLRAWKGLPKMRRSAGFSTWLYRITWNVASDRRKEIAKQRDRQKTLAGEASAQPAPTGDLIRLHYQETVRRGLEALSPEQRDVLVLHDLQDLPQKQIAQIVNVALGTVKSRLFAARKAMRAHLEREGIEL